jgi:hypothetical protein
MDKRELEFLLAVFYLGSVPTEIVDWLSEA